MPHRLVPALSALVVVVGASAALAQAAPPPARQACRAAALSLCADQVSHNDRPGVRACLIRNFDKVTPECQAAMKAVQAREQAKKPQPAPPAPGQPG
jgi:hypothetical protein